MAGLRSVCDPKGDRLLKRANFSAWLSSYPKNPASKLAERLNANYGATACHQSISVGLGDGPTPGPQRSFKHTLSARDRTTLALASLDCPLSGTLRAR